MDSNIARRYPAPAPVIEPGHTFASITDKITSIVLYVLAFQLIVGGFHELADAWDQLEEILGKPVDLVDRERRIDRMQLGSDGAGDGAAEPAAGLIGGAAPGGRTAVLVGDPHGGLDDASPVECRPDPWGSGGGRH